MKLFEIIENVLNPEVLNDERNAIISVHASRTTFQAGKSTIVDIPTPSEESASENVSSEIQTSMSSFVNIVTTSGSRSINIAANTADQVS